MIFVTLGTQKFQMNRLVKAMDDMAEEIGEEIFIQRGASTYIPRRCKYSDFLNSDEFAEKMKECSVLITHSGVGSIMTGIRSSKPVIVVPRTARLNEHVDDHQKQIAEIFTDKNLVLSTEDCREIPKLIEKAKSHNFNEYEAKGGQIEDLIIDFIMNNK